MSDNRKTASRLISSKASVYSILLFLALAWATLATYFWIDRSISVTHSSESVQRTAGARDQLAALLARSWAGLSRDDVMKRIKAAADGPRFSGAVIKSEGDTIVCDDLTFVFSNGVLIDVRT